MANEIQANLSVECSNGNFRSNFSPVQEVRDQSAKGGMDDTQTIGTTHSAITFGGLSVPGVTVVQNLDSTNYIQIGIVVSGTFYPSELVLPNEWHKLRFPTGVTMYAKSHTAACLMRVFCLET